MTECKLDPKVQVAVVGAAGVAGREVLAGLQSLGHPADRISALGAEHSEGEELEYLDDTVEVERCADESFRGMNLVFLATPADTSRRLAQVAERQGAWVVDLSGAFRADPRVPLWLFGVNDERAPLPTQGRVVATPSASSAALGLCLEPLRRAAGLEAAEVTALLGASSLGQHAVAQLERQTAGLLSGRDVEAERFPHRLGFNVIPQVGVFEGAWTDEERGWSAELARIWEGPTPPRVAGTALHVPTFYGLTLVVTAHLSRALSPEAARECYRGNALVKVLDAPAEKIYPMPMLVTADPTVHVGRFRTLPGQGDVLTFVVAADNAGRCSGLNAVDVGARLLERAR